jgi:hypothetical protein
MRLGKFYRRHLRYPLWRLLHPFTRYEAYYAWVVTRKLARGRKHPAIGPHAKAARGEREMIAVLLRHGLQPHHTLVDYGCGSLRLGKPLVEFLEPGKFWGLDLAQEFLDAGVVHIGALQVAKRPHLHVIGAEGLAAAKAARPDVIAAWHVCGKIPDQIFEDFFRKIVGLMHQRTRAFLQFEETPTRRQLHGLAWSIPRAKLIETLAAIDPSLRVTIHEVKFNPQTGIRYLYAEVGY